MPSDQSEPVVGHTSGGVERDHETTLPTAPVVTDEAGEEPSKKKSNWRELPVLVIAAIALSLLIRMFLVQAFYIPSESMQNTLQGCEGCSGNDRVLVWKLGTRFGDPKRGDIVVFDGRGSFWPNEDEKDYIKRVIGTGGDTVQCCDAEGRVKVDGQPLNETYLFQDDRQPFGPHVVPDGKLWMMGDHRNASADSRVGTRFVPVDRVVGKAFVIVWPPSRIRILR